MPRRKLWGYLSSQGIPVYLLSNINGVPHPAQLDAVALHCRGLRPWLGIAEPGTPSVGPQNMTGESVVRVRTPTGNGDRDRAHVSWLWAPDRESLPDSHTDPIHHHPDSYLHHW